MGVKTKRKTTTTTIKEQEHWLEWTLRVARLSGAQWRPVRQQTVQGAPLLTLCCYQFAVCQMPNPVAVGEESEHQLKQQHQQPLQSEQIHWPSDSQTDWAPASGDWTSADWILLLPHSFCSLAAAARLHQILLPALPWLLTRVQSELSVSQFCRSHRRRRRRRRRQ